MEGEMHKLMKTDVDPMYSSTDANKSWWIKLRYPGESMWNFHQPESATISVLARVHWIYRNKVLSYEIWFTTPSKVDDAQASLGIWLAW